MELQINELVNAIKKDGIDSANKEAEAIIANAKKQADIIMEDARNEAQKSKEKADREIKAFEESAKANADQARRDAVLSFKTEIEKELGKILAVKVRENLDDDSLAKLIRAVLTGEDVSAYAVELGNVGEDLQAALAEEVKNGLEIRTSNSISGGFKVVAKDGSGYFDCTDEEITGILMPYFRDICL